MRVLVVTARKAAEIVKSAVGDMAEVLVLDIDIAAFTTPARLKNSLPKEKYDLIIIPGLVSADFSIFEKQLDTPIRLGPKHAIDLGSVISILSELELSTTIPACELLITKRRENALISLEKIEESAIPVLMLDNVKIGGGSIMKVMAEVVDATSLSKNELTNRIYKFQEKGADIIDLGVGMAATPAEVHAAVQTAREISEVPLSIDTLDAELISAAVESGVDLVLSLNSNNIAAVGKIISEKNIVAVVIPDSEGGLESLFANIISAQNMGISKIIADPVLAPPGENMVDSMFGYRQFKQECPDIPIFFGVGNITELMDVDSVGVNAMLTALGWDLDVDILFTPEYSDKARGSISELKTAACMMTLAEQRKSPPKDLGMDLLILKEKRFRPFDVVPDEYIEAESSFQWTRDPAGSFKISISESSILEGSIRSGRIIAQHTKYTIVGDNAREVFDTILDMGLVSRLDHASYLGRELMKAELALIIGRSYSQDDEF
jgi:dihydropteroate synthase-like protein